MSLDERENYGQSAPYSQDDETRSENEDYTNSLDNTFSSNDEQNKDILEADNEREYESKELDDEDDLEDEDDLDDEDDLEDEDEDSELNSDNNYAQSDTNKSL